MGQSAHDEFGGGLYRLFDTTGRWFISLLAGPTIASSDSRRRTRIYAGAYICVSLPLVILSAVVLWFAKGLTADARETTVPCVISIAVFGILFGPAALAALLRMYVREAEDETSRVAEALARQRREAELNKERDNWLADASVKGLLPRQVQQVKSMPPDAVARYIERYERARANGAGVDASHEAGLSEVSNVTHRRSGCSSQVLLVIAAVAVLVIVIIAG